MKTFFPQIHLEICIRVSFPKNIIVKKNPFMSKIIDIEIIGLRVPTSDTLQGSDPFHKKPNYSCVLTRINTDDGLLGLSVNFSAGAGNDWLAYGVRDLSRLILGRDLEEFIGDPISFYRLLIDQYQLR